MSTLVSDERGEVVSSVELDSTAQTAQAAFALALAAQTLAELAQAQGVTAEQRADVAVLDAANALSVALQALAATDGDDKLSLSGGTMTGFLSLFNDPIFPTHAATRQYVDSTTSNLLGDVYTKAEVYSKPEIDQLAQSIVISSGVPQGAIMLWFGSTPPAGWAICDGSNGTPDLRSRVPIGAGTGFPFGSVGGSATHTHTLTINGTALTAAQLPNHAHSVNLTAASAGSHTHTGTTTSNGEHTHAVTDVVTSGGTGHYSLGFNGQLNPFKVTSSAGLHNHDLETLASGEHTHTVSGTTAATGSSATHTHTATAAQSNNMPPYLALNYIMKL